VGVRLGEFITRLRGNPIALSTLLIALVAALVGIAVAKPNLEILAGALIGASVSSIVGLLITFLGEPDLKTVPRPFLEAVKHELEESGYYRSRHHYTITIPETKQDQIIIIFSSRIVPAGGKAKVKPPKIVAPQGLSLEKREYKVGGFPKDFDAEFEITGIETEVCSVTYKTDGSNIKTVRETHRWSSPIDGFILTAHLPPAYIIRAETLGGLSLEEEQAHSSLERIFLRREVSFSHQGFVWRIMKEDAHSET
jgi:hypothetical protein